MDGSNFEGTHVSERAGEHPDFPVRADAVGLSVRADRSIAAVGDNVREPLRLHAEVVVRKRAHPAAAQMRHELAPGSPALEFGIFPDVADLVEVLLVPRCGPANGERWRVNGVGLAEEFGDVAVERHIGRGMLKTGLAVHEHGNLVQEIAGAFAGDAKMLFPRNFGDPLALLAVRLQILFESCGAVRCNTIDLMFGDLKAGELIPSGAVAV